MKILYSLSENRDNQANQCDNVQSWIEKSRSFDEENEMNIESH
jgi:hypothetical protein